MVVEIPMSHPATAVKNPDGTWSVRIQHTTEGQITSVDFTNVLFAEVLAKGYADMLNGKAATESQLRQIASDIGPAVSDAAVTLVRGTKDVAKLIAEAETEALKLVEAAKTEASLLRADAEGYAAAVKKTVDAAYTEAKTEAEKLLDEARQKASEILKVASEKVAPASTPKNATVEDE